MRIIRTEEYFGASEVNWSYHELIHGNPGVSITFIGMSNPGPQNLNNLDRFSVNISPMGNPDIADAIIDHFLDAAIQGATDNTSSHDLLRLDRALNQPLISKIRQLDVIIEHSPPLLINFSELLKSAGPAVAIGTFVGVSATTYPILLATVPAGIIIVGAAIAVSKAIEDSLPKVIERWMSRSTEQAAIVHS